MALCEGQLDSVLPQIKSEEREEAPNQNPNHLAARPGLDSISVDYTSPRAHFVPPAVERLCNRPVASELADSGTDDTADTADTADTVDTASGSNASGTPPIKRKRGRPRVDKTSPEYLAKSAARKQVKEMNMMNDSGEKKKRGRPRIDKNSPEYLARKRAKEIEAMEKKAKRQYKRRTTADSGASSSTGDTTPKVKRKYTKRPPGVGDAPGKRGRKRKLILGPDGQPIIPSSSDKVKGKRGRPRKDAPSGGAPQTPLIRVRNNLMPEKNEQVPVESDEDLGSPGNSDSLSFDENLRALRHLHEKYANIGKDDQYSAHLLAANFKKPPADGAPNDQDDVVSLQSSGDSSNSSDSSSSGSSSSSSSSSESSSSDSSDSEAEPQVNGDASPLKTDSNTRIDDDRSFGPWSYKTNSDSSDSESEKSSTVQSSQAMQPAVPAVDSLSESENESPDKSFQCHICKKWYSTIVTLKIHRRSHLNRGSGGGSGGRTGRDKYECDSCDSVFSRREKLWEHRAEVHRGSMTVRCEVCRKCFEDDSELATHSKTHTQDERNGRCSICGTNFLRYDQLRRHMASAHSTSAHVCNQCGKSFTHPHSLTRHLHNHARTLYRCVVCKASFGRADQLAQHLNSHLANYKRLKP